MSNALIRRTLLEAKEAFLCGERLSAVLYHGFVVLSAPHDGRYLDALKNKANWEYQWFWTDLDYQPFTQEQALQWIDRVLGEFNV